MLVGMAVGYLFRKQNLSWLQRLITGLIWLLLFILGLQVGSNERIISGLHCC